MKHIHIRLIARTCIDLVTAMMSQVGYKTCYKPTIDVFIITGQLLAGFLQGHMSSPSNNAGGRFTNRLKYTKEGFTPIFSATLSYRKSDLP